MGSPLALRAVTKRYSWRGPWVLGGVDLEAAPGSLTAVVGANGSGKSTLLRIAAGLVSPSGGAVQIPTSVAYVPERQPARLKFSASEYLANMGRIKGLGAAVSIRKGAELLDHLGLQPGPDSPWESLSRGNRQKVLIAQAFLTPTALTVLDEPYSGLDEAGRGALDELVEEAQAQGAAILLSAHRTEDLRRVDEFCQLVAGGLETRRPGAGDVVARRVRSKRIVLTTPLGRLPAPPGTFIDEERTRSERTGQRLVLTVADEHVDDVLTAALTMGWSVASVGRFPERG